MTHNLEALICVEGNLSRQFEQSMEEILAPLPPSLSQLASAGGIRIVATPTVIDHFPELKNIQPRGWSAGSSWANCDGLYNSDSREVVFAQSMLLRSNGQLVQSSSRKGVLLHEFGHAIDELLGWYSQSPEFVAAYLADVSKVFTTALEPELAYYLQGFELTGTGSLPSHGAAGLGETFADVFAAIHGSSANRDKTKLILAVFKRVAMVIRKKLETL